MDIDGVLNSQKSVERFGNFLTFAPESVEALNHILDSTDARIVISSMWRILHDLNKLRKIFDSRGIDGSRIIGATPDFQTTSRGLEIDDWLRQACVLVESFVIIDDNSNMGMHVERLVKTSFETGLNMDHAERAIRMLEED